jgi:putative membrane protein
MILQAILRFLVLAASIYVIARLCPGVRIRGFKSALVVSAVYGMLNFLLFRVLIFITFPLVILKYLTLGIFGVVLNAVLLMLTDRLVKDFELAGFGAALLASIGISVVNLLLSLILL